MTTLVRWEPFLKDFSNLTERFNRMFEGRGWEDVDRPLVNQFGAWYPPVDIQDRGGEILIEAELPGMKKEDIDIRIENNVLTLQGQRKREHEAKEEGYFRSERVYGGFSRSFTLPSTVAVNKITASYKDGVLTVSLPKAEEAKPRQIEVKVS